MILTTDQLTRIAARAVEAEADCVNLVARADGATAVVYLRGNLNVRRDVFNEQIDLFGGTNRRVEQGTGAAP